MLAGARTRIVRYTPEEARADPDLLLVDTRSGDERERDGEIPGALQFCDLIGGFEAW